MAKILKIINILKTLRFWKGLVLGVAAGVEHQKVLKMLDCQLVVDVGANKGQFALISRFVFPEAKIISFEPLDLPADKFLKLFNNDANTTLHKYAIGIVEEESEIHISAKMDSSSLLPIAILQGEIFPGTNEIGVETVKIAPLGKFIKIHDVKDNSLLKIDVQGFEKAVLQGCQDLLERFTFIYVECSFMELYEGQALADEIIQYLHNRKFDIKGIYNVSYDKNGIAVQGDFLFIKRNIL